MLTRGFSPRRAGCEHLAARPFCAGDAMLYEYRRYHVAPGRMAELVDRMCNETSRFLTQYGIRLVGAWTTVIGNTNDLHFMLAWTDLEERQDRWRAFTKDPAWHAVLRESDGDGKIREYGQNEIWAPIESSPLQ
jgi:hypothetical protein